jgi:hypothetical protein
VYNLTINIIKMPGAQKILDYNKMKASELKKLCEQREIQCKMVVKDMVDALKLEEKGEWIFHTEQIKQKNGGFIVKIDYRNKNQLIKMGQLVEKKISRRLEVYSMYRLWFKVEQEFRSGSNFFR